MEKFLRSWRQDALNRGQHESAIYIGDKVLALTSKDLFHLCSLLESSVNGRQTATLMHSGLLRCIFLMQITPEP